MIPSQRNIKTTSFTYRTWCSLCLILGFELSFTHNMFECVWNHGQFPSIKAPFDHNCSKFKKLPFLAEPEWPSGLQHRVCCVRRGWLWVRAPNLHQCLWTLLQVCESKRLGCHADLYTVSRCCTRGESEDHTSKKVCKGIHPGFETQGRHHQKSKTGVSVAPRRGLMSSKFFFKKLPFLDINHISN